MSAAGIHLGHLVNQAHPCADEQKGDKHRQDRQRAERQRQEKLMNAAIYVRYKAFPKELQATA
jgi:hypothetical protein